MTTDRQVQLLLGLNTRGRGIEIGPSHSPVAPKAGGYDVTVIDVLDQPGLIEKYRPHGVDVSKIEAVDYVWRGETLSRLTGKTRHFDWIIASHVVEHTTDLVSFLNSCAEVLTESGIVSLAVPDKRYCFDTYRPVSALGAVIDRHLHGAVRHTAGSIAEFMLNACSRGGQISWHPGHGGEVRFLCEEPATREHFAAARSGKLDMDVHAWCFTPASFRLLVRDLNFLGLISLRELRFQPGEGHEFFVQLTPDNSVPLPPREPLLRAIETENRG